MDKHIVLIGFMGAGKTTVGRQLARLTSARLLDTDAMIEKQAGMTVSRIFETRGEDFFRRTETLVLEELAEMDRPAVISTGGGMPMKDENQRALRAMGCVVYLRTEPQTVLQRLSGDTTRPLLQGEGKEERVKQLLALRDPVYRETAHLVVETDGRKPAKIAEDILNRLRLGTAEEARGGSRRE